MPGKITLIKGDITKQSLDAIVNAANTTLLVTAQFEKKR